jgi:hypothetical protein
VHETTAEIAAVQALLDRSYARASSHLLAIHTPERRVTAAQLVARLDGMCLLTLATVTRDGRPVGGPVDGIFYRGAFHFGSAAHSVRFRHLRERPWVTATYLPAEEFAVTVHGRAVPVEIGDGGFRETLIEVYVPRYGAEWVSEFLDGAGAAGSRPAYARIEAERMFAFGMPEPSSAEAMNAARTLRDL